MKYTSAEAGKLVKKLEERIRDLLEVEHKRAFFNAASTEDVEKLRPRYDFAKTQEQIEQLQRDVRTVKHAINVFNTTHEVKGYDGLTIDQALILIPQLNVKKDKLRKMAACLEKERVDEYFGRSNIIDYRVANFDIDAAKKAYQDVSDELAKLQLSLDAVNTSEAMDIDVGI